jgi:hypothetical protein
MKAAMGLPSSACDNNNSTGVFVVALISDHHTLSRQKTLDFIEKLEEYSSVNSYSLYLPPHPDRSEAKKSLQEISVPAEMIPQIWDSLDKSHAGGVIFWGSEGKYLVIPPFPVTEKLLVRGFSTEILHSLLEKDYLIGIVLVRLGAYGVGVSRGETFVSSKVGTGNIHGRHKKGGSSAHRFERHRDKQIEYFFTRVCQHAREHLEPHVKSLDYLAYGGAHTTIRDLNKQCSFLERLDTPQLPPLLDIPEPRQAVLKMALDRIWSSTVYEWHEED